MGDTFNPGKNLKADIFENYMKKENLNFFQRRDTHDHMDTVAFITAVPGGDKHRLVAAVLTNNSMYTVLRVHLGLAPAGPAYKTFLDFLNKYNREHSFFKYIVTEDKNAFLDVCITSRPDRLDCEVIRTTLNLIIYHLKENYEDIARRLYKTSDETDGFEL